LKLAAKQAYFENLPVRNTKVTDEMYRMFSIGSLMDLFILDTRIEGRTKPQLFDSVFFNNISDHHIISSTQSEWLYKKLSASKATWKVIASPVVVGQIYLNEETSAFLESSGVDQWDGYESSRKELLELLNDEAISNVIFISGGMATSLVHDIAKFPGLTQPLGVEFVGPAVSSVTPAQKYSDAVTGPIFDALALIEPHLKYADAYHWGYVVMDVDTAKTTANYIYMDTIQIQNPTEWVGKQAYTLDTYNCVSDEFTCPDDFNAATSTTIVSSTLLMMITLLVLLLTLNV
jgi:alkaline phosphatase D